MSSYMRKREEGFTIIEVMIVLAIAGLIMLIVFLAVPALQRTARNTQRKADASAIGAAVANFIDNNGGTLPVGLAVDSADPSSIDICGLLPSGANGGFISPLSTNVGCGTGANYETAKLGYYAFSASVKNFTLENNIASDTETSTTQIKIDTGYGCNPTNTGASSTANPRTAAILSATENASSYSTQCIEQ